jgi:dTDP-4-dehydrorhamnose reductase
LEDDRLPVYVLFGIGGLLGDAFYARLCEKVPNHRIFAFDHLRVDISNRAHVAPMLSYILPTAVINCAALNDPDMCEDAKEGAFYANAVGPRILAEECCKVKARLLHLSSCSVFSGTSGKPYSETDETAPLGTHGNSKLEGEKAVLKAFPDSLVVRPGWCFHYEGNNFLTDWIARAERGLSITVPRDCQGSPTYVLDLVDASLCLMDKDASGIFHFANSGTATWSLLAETVGSLAKTNVKVVPMSTEMKSLFKSPVQRYATLSTEKYVGLAGKKPRSWETALRNCLFQMNRYKP